MASKKRDFYGKEVTDAIKKACDKLGVPQEQMEIEVVETGSTGIFGLIRKKAHIRAYVKEAEITGGKQRQKKTKKETPQPAEPAEGAPSREKTPDRESSQPTAPPESRKVEPDSIDEPPPSQQEHTVEQPLVSEEKATEAEQGTVDESEAEDPVEELPEEVIDLVKKELDAILNLMGYPSEIEVHTNGTALTCRISETHEAVLTGEDGKTLDSIQYLLRKIVARKVPSRLRLTVDVGNYREKRLDELKERAIELAARVKEDGKTQVIAALSPSERRVIHMSLQDDKEIRSRSVGEGLFKKILIYKPGKGGKGGGRKRNSSRGRRNSNNRRKNT